MGKLAWMPTVNAWYLNPKDADDFELVLRKTTGSSTTSVLEKVGDEK